MQLNNATEKQLSNNVFLFSTDLAAAVILGMIYLKN